MYLGKKKLQIVAFAAFGFGFLQEQHCTCKLWHAIIVTFFLSMVFAAFTEYFRHIRGSTWL